MGKVKEYAMTKNQKIDEKISELEESTREIESQNFDEKLEVDKFKEIVFDLLEIIKEIKGVILI